MIVASFELVGSHLIGIFTDVSKTQLVETFMGLRGERPSSKRRKKARRARQQEARKEALEMELEDAYTVTSAELRAEARLEAYDAKGNSRRWYPHKRAMDDWGKYRRRMYPSTAALTIRRLH